MSVAGIDFSSLFVDVVLLDEDSDRAEWHRMPLEGVDAFDRARVVRAMWFIHFGSAILDDTIAVGIEDPRGYGAGSLYRIQGAILSCLPRSLLVHPLIPSQWRKACGLPGNASKGDVAWWSDSAWPNRPDALPQDALDAFCIAYATRSLIQTSAAA